MGIFSKNGMKKDLLEALNALYSGLPELIAPTLNPQISAAIKDYAITRE